MKSRRCKINWIAKRSFAVVIDCGDRKVAVELPIELLTTNSAYHEPDMVEGQEVLIVVQVIDEGDA